MSFLKRHLWLAITLGAMVLLSAGAVVFLVVFQGRTAARQTVLVKSQSMLKSIGNSYYNEKAAGVVTEAVAFRQKQLESIEKYVATQGNWAPLTPSVLRDDYSETNVYTFRDTYKNTGIPALLRKLNAVSWDARAAVDPAAITATMYAHANAFYKDPWLDATILPRSPDEVMQRVRDSQDDYWLMEDIVEAIRRTNDLCFGMTDPPTPADQQLVAGAVIKELHKIDIGAQVLSMARGGSGTLAGRYLYIEPPAGDAWSTGGEEKTVDTKAMTLTGRSSDNDKGRYRVLPFRVTVIADAGNCVELVRQITGTRSFITVLNVRYEMIPDVPNLYSNTFQLMRPDIATRVQVYGPRPICRMTLTCESLVFRLDNARPTVPSAKKKAEG